MSENGFLQVKELAVEFKDKRDKGCGAAVEYLFSWGTSPSSSGCASLLE